MSNYKIPKIIHYCWFGRNEKPLIVKRCIESWKSNLKEYEIKEWNEDTFEINSNVFVKHAYECKKYAFVSDYVRVYALYNYGGIYLDTDVEVLKNFDNLLMNNSFWGFEEKNYIATSIIGATKQNKLIKNFLDYYDDKKFSEDCIETNVEIVTNIFTNLGVKLNGKEQEIKGLLKIYSQEYFSPYDYINCIDKRSENTYTIHYFYKSWLPLKTRIKTIIKKAIVFGLGKNTMYSIRKYILKN